MTRAGLAILVAVLLAACGSAGSASGERTRALSDRLWTSNAIPPTSTPSTWIQPTAASAHHQSRLLPIDPDSRKVAEVRGAISARGRRAAVGTFLELLVTGPGRLLGSGHPDRPGTLPGYLGFIRSDDGGRTWRVVARLGEADLHKIVAIHGRLYAFDAVLGAILISEDGGRTFTENFTPRALVIDFVVDPQDPAHVIASTEDQVFRSERRGLDVAGHHLRPRRPARVARARRPRARGPRRDRDGVARPGPNVQACRRGARRARTIQGPRRPTPPLALSDGTIMRTDDGGVTWTTAFAA
jgi:hypothetical protein